ncbi:trigger factor [Paraeggerthella sp.]|uniref:trigger factor n=1 Tax=Paraeggerthella sp. TaxID=2897350 RepID=UPI003529B163
MRRLPPSWKAGRSQLEQGKADYQSGLAEYERQKTEASDKLADAESQLNKAQKQIDDLAAPEWMVMDRDANYGVASFEADANRVDSIAQVFPFIFFLVAALVALTTMTRMVEEERTLIGTFKALGYRRTRIAGKYLVYAAVASGAGSLVGIAVLSQVLPAVIMRAYGIIYFVPNLPFPLPIDPFFALLSAGMGVGVTLLATLAAAAATLRERPALLMLPRAPKAGKRILLERATPLWKRLSFTWKVTFRNLFRYKKRFIMTVIGIAGCTALLLTGLGLSDAINDIIDKQFRDLTKYNVTITLDDDASKESLQTVDAVLDDSRLASGHTAVDRQNLLASGPGKSDAHIELVVPQDPGSFRQFFDLRTRVGHHPVELADDGLLLAEKLAGELGVSVGDTVTLTEQDAIGNATNTSYEATVTGVVENYVYNYAFMGPKLYERLTGEAPAFSTVLTIASTDSSARADLVETLQATDGVKTVASNDETIDAYHDMLSSVNMIVVVLVVAAAALAFIVLYNLTNINITERMREIATLKVLGFTPREMNAYIFRETFLLAAIGCAVGLVLGVWMEGFVVVTAEVDQVMFGRTIHALSFLWAFFAHHAVHVAGHAGYARQTSPHRHGRKPQVQRVMRYNNPLTIATEGDPLMKVTEKKLEDGLILLDAVVSTAEVSHALTMAQYGFAQQMGIQAQPGKPVAQAVEEQMGIKDLDAIVQQQAIEYLVPFAIDKRNIMPAYPPQPKAKEPLKRGQTFSFELRVAPKPEYELTSYDQVTITVPPLEVPESEVDAQIAQMAESYAEFVTDEPHPVGAGDSMMLALEAFQGGERIENLSTDGRTYLMGMGLMPEAFESNLMGMEVGDTKSFSFEFPPPPHRCRRAG